MKHFTRMFKNKKYLVITSCTLILLFIGWSLINSLSIKPPRLYLSSEFSKTIQSIPGSYCWSNWRGGVCTDSFHPTEFQYTSDNTLVIGRNEQIILSNKKMKIDRHYSFELSTLECFDENKAVIDYRALPTYSNNDLYINAPSANGVCICNAVLKYKQGTVSYGYKLVVTSDENKLNY